jgi:DNA-binding beta-propeller fold protein YncE
VRAQANASQAGQWEAGWTLRDTIRRAALGALCALVLAVGAAPAQAAFDDPLFVFRPVPGVPLIPPPVGEFEGPCGLAVDGAGDFYVSDYYHHVIDLFGPGRAYGGQIAAADPLDGPCGLALDATGGLYVNDYHRSVIRFGAAPGSGSGTVIAGAPLDAARPTGVAVDQDSGDVYVDERGRIAVFDPAGAAKGEVGGTSLEAGFGLAVSQFPATRGLLYVPDAGDDTVKVYDPATDPVNPVAVLDGAGTPNGGFVSLRDAAVAVDRVSGEVYVADDLQPLYTERPEVVVQVFSAAGSYEGRLKFGVVDGLPVGLAVDNSATATQGRVYVTSGNEEQAAVYAYPPHAATSAAISLATPALLAGGTGEDPRPATAAGAVVAPLPAASDAGAGSSVSWEAAPVSAAPRSHHARRHGRAKRAQRAAQHRRGRGGR